MAELGSPIGGLLQGFNSTYWPAVRHNEAIALQQAQEKRAQDLIEWQKQKYAESEAKDRQAAGLYANFLGIKPTMSTPRSADDIYRDAEAAGDFMGVPTSTEQANPQYEQFLAGGAKAGADLVKMTREQQMAELKARSDAWKEANAAKLADIQARRLEALVAKSNAPKGKATLFMDEEGKQVVPLVPGQDEIPPGWRPYDKKLFGMGDKFKARLESENENAKLMTRTIDDAMKYADAPLAAGRFSDTVSSVDPESSAYQLRKSIETLKANIGFDRLQAMREQSPTGGALGQVAVQELQALQATLGNLDPRQRPEVLKENLKSIREKYQRIMQKFNSAGSGSGSASKPADPLGLR